MLVPSAQGRHRGRSGWFRRTHGRAKAQSRLGRRRPVATPWLRRAEARGARLVSYGAKHILSVPALRGVRASAETPSALKGPPRVLGNSVLESPLPCSQVQAFRTAAVSLAKGVQRSFRPF